jgi:hypothetical protein
MCRVYQECRIEISEGFFQFLLSQVDSKTLVEVVLVQWLQLYNLIIRVKLISAALRRNIITNTSVEESFQDVPFPTISEPDQSRR